MARDTLQRNPPCSDALLVPCASLAVTHCVCHFSTLPTYPGLCVQGSAPSLLLPWRLKPPRPQLRPQLRRRNSVSCTQRTTPMTMARPHMRPCMHWLARVLPSVMLHCVRRVSEGDRDPHGTRPHLLLRPDPGAHTMLWRMVRSVARSTTSKPETLTASPSFLCMVVRCRVLGTACGGRVFGLIGS